MCDSFWQIIKELEFIFYINFFDRLFMLFDWTYVYFYGF